MKDQPSFIPALSYARFTPLYDRLLRWLFAEARFKRALIAQARLRPDQIVLDLGCGTGTLALMIKQADPAVVINAIDIDRDVLRIAQRKVERANVDIYFEQGSVTALPFADATFDRVVTSLVLHHLTTVQKQAALDEAWRVLKPDGELHIADFGQPHTILAQAIGLVTRYFEQVADNIAGRIPVMLRRAGFVDTQIEAQRMTLVGTLALYHARKL